jgi:hypothetical protein
VTRCQFVADHQRRYGVKRLCTIIGIARSSFYYWRKTAPARAARQAADDQLARRIRAVHTESDGTYGVPRITAELREDGERVNHKRVARVMRTIGLAGLRLRKKHRTTIPDPAAVKVADLIGRDFTAEHPNAKYVGDITYLPVSGAKPLPGDGHRSVLTPPGGLGDRRPYAGRTRRRCPGGGRADPRQSRRRDFSLRPRFAIYECRVRRRLRTSGREKKYERGRQ